MTQGHLSLIIALFLGTSRIAAGWEIANRDEIVEMLALIKPVIGPAFYSPRSFLFAPRFSRERRSTSWPWLKLQLPPIQFPAGALPLASL